MRKRHFIDNINVKTSQTIQNVNCDVNTKAKVKVPNPLHAGLPDIDLIMCNKDYQHCLLRGLPILR